MVIQRKRSAGEDPSRVELELQERVTRAREEYERAIAEARKLAAWNGDGDARLNRSSEITRALQLQNTATRRYSEALRSLSEFVLDYKHTNCA